MKPDRKPEVRIMATRQLSLADILGFVAYMFVVGGRLPDGELLRSAVAPTSAT